MSVSPSPDHGARIPADVERPDRILGQLTAGQLAILVPAGVLVWMAYLTTKALLPLPVFAALAVPALGAAAALALVEHDGVGLDRLLLHALRQRRAPSRLVLASGQVPPLPRWVATAGEAAPLAPLRLPAKSIGPDGVIDLGGDGVAVVVACSTVSFALRTPGEQAALVGAFGAWLNSLTGPTQILVHAVPINLGPAVTQLRDRAAGLAHPALEDAAHDHADFLTRLAATRDLLARRVLVVIREPHITGRPGAGSSMRGGQVRGTAAQALRRADQAARALSAAGITAHVLDGGQATAALVAAADPTAPSSSATDPAGSRSTHSAVAVPGESITARRKARS